MTLPVWLHNLICAAMAIAGFGLAVVIAANGGALV